MMPQQILKPELAWQGMVPLLMLAGLFVFHFLIEILRAPKSRTTGGFWTLLVSLLGVVYLTACPDQPVGAVVHKMWIYDGVTRLGSLLVFLSLAAVTLIIPKSVEESGHLGEYYALLSGAALGMVMLMGSNNLLVTFLALELFSLALYLLCIFLPDRSTSQESGLKYFILSSLASAVILYGMALIYGATGSTWLHEIGARASQGGLLMIVGSTLLAAGLAFKVSAVPFHVWTPDVYQGAPTPVTAFMSVATKTAALVALLRFFPMTLGMAGDTHDGVRTMWAIIIWSLAMLSMLFGNLMALSQTNLKRLLAYSGIAQAGYLLGAIFMGTPIAKVSLFYYLLVYLCMNVGAFVVVAALEEVDESLDVHALAGLSMRQPYLAAALAVFLFSLTGLPPTAGFVAKYQLFSALMASGPNPLPKYLVAAALVGSLMSAGYYLRFVVQAYGLGPAPEPHKQIPPTYLAVIATAVVAVFALSFWAGPVLEWMQRLLGT
ncbi:NADH-quinone oxidoreductase subunit N [bacterium]|nr:NADH-quinone oxidoreductase subunit N [bacterium]